LHLPVAGYRWQCISCKVDSTDGRMNTGAASSELLLNRNVVEYDGTHVAVECTYTGRRTMLAADAIVTVTSRLPNEELALALAQMPERVAAAHIASVTPIGDCGAPSTLAAAVYAGHRHAREFDRPPDDRASFRRELVDLQC
jgi:dimethylamine/trimethylamine dehydrogenase